jgi:hypothetical protein
MFKFLWHDGYLIDLIRHDLTPIDILALNRLSKIIQFVSAAVIIIEVMGTARATGIIAFFAWPFLKVRDFSRRMIQGTPPPPTSFDPYWGPWIFTGMLLLLWAIASSHSLTYWMAYPVGVFAASWKQGVEAVVPVRSETAFKLLGVFWKLMWGMLSAELFVVLPFLAIFGTIGVVLGRWLSTPIKIEVFRMMFYSVFVFGWVLEFLTSK